MDLRDIIIEMNDLKVVRNIVEEADPDFIGTQCLDIEAKNRLHRLSGEYGTLYDHRSVDMDSIESSESLKDECIRTLLRCEVAYLKMNLDRYSNDRQGSLFKDLEEFCFISVPFPGKDPVSIPELLRIVRNAMIHGKKKGKDDLPVKTGFINADDLLFTCILLVESEDCRTLSFIHEPIIDEDGEEIGIPRGTVYLGDLIVDEYTTLLGMYIDHLETGRSAEHYSENSGWKPIVLSHSDEPIHALGEAP